MRVVLASMIVGVALLVASAAPPPLDAPTSYPNAITHRNALTAPTPPTLGAAGSIHTDSVFGNRVLRVTDGNTMPGALNSGHMSPSGPNQHAWNADSTRFYTLGGGGTIIPWNFNAATFQASRINPTGVDEGGFVLSGLRGEPQFSYLDPDIIYGGENGDYLNFRQYDFGTGTYTVLLDLTTTVAADPMGLDWGPSGDAERYIGGVSSSAGAVEKLTAFFGGTSQDSHMLAIVFEKDTPANRKVVNTQASTLNGVAMGTTLGFTLHNVVIDRSGRYVSLYPIGSDIDPGGKAQVYYWDTQTDTFTAGFPTANHSGHDAYGYAMRMNQSEGTGTYDDAQWMYHADLSSPLSVVAQVSPVLSPTSNGQFGEHGTWNNARSDALTPYFSATYTRGAARTLRAWDDEIIAILPNADPANTVVYRFAHTHANVHRDDTPGDGRIGFWYTPRGQVSDDGRYVFWTSNWGKTLGSLGAGFSEPSEGMTNRYDVFMVELPVEGGEPPPASGSVLRLRIR